MIIRLEPISVSNRFNQHSGGFYQYIIIDALIEGNGVVEIGRHHIFINPKNKSISDDDRRERVNCNIQISTFGNAGNDFITQNGVGEKKAGLMTFYCRDRDDSEEFQATINIQLFVTDDLFNTFYENVLHISAVSQLSINLDTLNNNEIQYGWELDGSRIVWHLDNESKNLPVAVKNFDISFGQISIRAQDSENNDIIRQQPAEKPMPKIMSSHVFEFIQYGIFACLLYIAIKIS